MTRINRSVYLTAIAALILLVVFLVFYLRFTSKRIDCSDGLRQTIDLGQFSTEYSGYSAQLELSLGEKANLRGKLEPKQLQQISESLQQANEFRKWLVAGYNGCAISRAQYADFGSRFQAMDNLAREIDSFTNKPNLSPSEKDQLADLVEQYVRLSQTLVASR